MQVFCLQVKRMCCLSSYKNSIYEMMYMYVFYISHFIPFHCFMSCCFTTVCRKGSSQFEGAMLVYTRNVQFSYTRNAQFSLYQNYRNVQFWYTSNVQFLHSRTDNWCNSHYTIIIGCTCVRLCPAQFRAKVKNTAIFMRRLP